MKKSKISVGDNIEAKRHPGFRFIEHNNFEQHVSKSGGYKTGMSI